MGMFFGRYVQMLVVFSDVVKGVLAMRKTFWLGAYLWKCEPTQIPPLQPKGKYSRYVTRPMLCVTLGTTHT